MKEVIGVAQRHFYILFAPSPEVQYPMSLLYEAIAARVDTWQAAGYPCAECPAIAEILGYSIDHEQAGQRRL